VVFTTRYDDVFTLPKLVVLWAALVAIAWLLVVWAPPAAVVRWQPPVDVALGLFVALNAVALARSTDHHQSVFGERLQHQGALTLLLGVAFFFVARIAVRDADALRRVLTGMVVGATVVSGYAVVQAVGLDPIWGRDLPGDRVFSTIGQPNALAAYLVLVLPVALVLAWHARRWARLAAAVGATAMLATLVLTLSRGGYVGLAATVPVLLFGAFADQRTRRRAVGGVVVAIVAVVAAIAATPSGRSLVRRASGPDPAVDEALAGSGGDISFRAHVDQWRVALRVIADHPLTGTGQETFPDQFPQASRLVLSPARVRYFDLFRVESPHNAFLGVAAGAGAPALMAYLAFLGAVLVALARSAAATVDRGTRLLLFAVLAALVGHVVTDQFMGPDVTGAWLAWCLAGAAVGTSRQLR
jgi:O-antigen ligase